jgi:hypothetical protein
MHMEYAACTQRVWLDAQNLPIRCVSVCVCVRACVRVCVGVAVGLGVGCVFC